MADTMNAVQGLLTLDYSTLPVEFSSKHPKSVYTKCHLCHPKSQKRFDTKRGIFIHWQGQHDLTDWSSIDFSVLPLFAARKGDAPAGAEVIADFLWACREGRMDVVETKLKQRPKASIAQLDLDKHRSTALDWAAGNGQVEVMKVLIAHEVAVQGARGRGDVAVGELLVQLGETSAIRSGARGGRTALHWAARNGQLEAVQYLLSLSVPVDTGAADDTTALHLALYGCHLEVAKSLVEAGASLRWENSFGCSAIHWAAMCTRHSRDARLSAEKRATLDGETGELAFDAVQFVLEHAHTSSLTRNDVLTMKQKSGHTALHKACQRNNMKLVQWLLANTPPEHHTLLDVQGNTPADIAKAFGGDEICKLF